MPREALYNIKRNIWDCSVGNRDKPCIYSIICCCHLRNKTSYIIRDWPSPARLTWLSRLHLKTNRLWTSSSDNWDIGAAGQIPRISFAWWRREISGVSSLSNLTTLTLVKSIKGLYFAILTLNISGWFDIFCPCEAFDWLWGWWGWQPVVEVTSEGYQSN